MEMEMEMKDMKLLSGIESHGGNGNFKGSILIESEKYDTLSEDTQNNISFKASDFLQVIQHSIEMEWAKANEIDKRSAHVAELTELFKLAGFNTIYVETIDNQYCGDACCYKYPWIIITTERGRIKLGWRKRVMNLDWSESRIKAIGTELFKDEETTKGTDYIHCWGKEKAIEYLKKLNSEE